jgi:NAD(P)-dependent dehydrogenase (short-subunit alcohol dehydrogenase family)
MKKRVLVTGAALRLGAAIAETFAAAGWHVLCHYRNEPHDAQALCQRLHALGCLADTVCADLALPGDCTAMMGHIGQTWGPLDALVNNASTFVPDTGRDFDPAQAAGQLQVNLLAPLLLARLMAAMLPPGAEGCTIHVLDQKVYNLNPDYFSYTVSKLALERAVALQAQALAPQMRVCGVAPGLMYVSGPQSQGNFERAANANLLRRPTDPQDVARTCLFLASTASITGTTVSVDNGQHLVPLPRDIMFVVDELLKPHDATPSSPPHL